MGFLRKVTVRQQLYAVGAITTLLLLAIAVPAINATGRMKGRATDSLESMKVTVAVTNAYQAWLTADDQANMWVALATLGDPAQKQLTADTYQQFLDAIDEANKQIEIARNSTTRQESRDILDTISANVDAYDDFTIKAHDLIDQGEVKAAVQTQTVDNLEPSEALPTDFGRVVDLERAGDVTNYRAMISEAGSTRRMIMLLGILAQLLLLVALAYVGRSITRPIERTVAVLEGVAGGDLTRRLEHDREDEFGRIATALNTAVISLEQAQDDVARAEQERAARAAQDLADASARAEAERLAAEEERKRLEADAARAAAAAAAEAERERQAAADEAERQRAAAALEQQTLNERMAREKEIAEAEAAAAADLRAKVDALLTVVDAAAGGDLTCPVTVTGDDAIGQLAGGLDKLLQTLRASIGEIASHSLTLASASEELSVTSSAMGDSVQETATEADAASTKAQQVAADVRAVADGADYLTGAIREIATSAREASTVAQRAVGVADSANTTVSRLGASSSEIAGVLDLISSIAAQTNLLALNATIEAARAGEAGKGFAVVASEVKELSNQTRTATEEIRRQIEEIQSDTTGTVAAISEIVAIIDQISSIQSSISSAVDEQAATTDEMSRRIAEAASGTGAITGNVARVASVAGDTSLAAEQSLDAAGSVSRMAAELQTLVGQFRYEIAKDARAPRRDLPGNVRPLRVERSA
ncbi:hypothetical protein GCM10022215_01960 [Nocardioides fonticola]|uniref:Methyl-accepting chemotaxis protein n=1 Tax=Nocardioides fonticola TaxID=450363 RepID=A0ABP7X9I4_9ACTN